MKITKKRINAFLLFKLPLGWLSGMRVTAISNTTATVSIKHRWINQNPFKSMFWAAQGMAAELSTGVLVMQAIAKADKKVSMLVVSQHAEFYKKARGNITFTCTEGAAIEKALLATLKSNEGQVVVLQAKGIDASNTVVSHFSFKWSLKAK